MRLNKRNYSDYNIPSPKKMKEIPWLEWSAAETSLKTTTATRDFLEKSQTHDLYVDDPEGNAYHFFFEIAKSSFGLQIEACMEQENEEKPLVDLSVSAKNHATIRWIEASNPELFESAWKITKLTLNLWEIHSLKAIDDALTEEDIPRQLIHAFQGQCCFQKMGLIPTSEVKEAQEFLKMLTLDDLKGILSGFSGSIAKITCMQNQHLLDKSAPVGNLLRLLNGEELKILQKECLTPWNALAKKDDSPLLKPYLNALETLSKANRYTGTSTPDNQFEERLHSLISQYQNPVIERDHISIVLSSRTDREFQSEGLSDRLLRESPRHLNAHHIYLTVQEKIDDQLTTVLKITFSPQGKNAELCWIQKGNQLSGHEVFQIFNRIDEALQPENIYLFDDAKVFIGEKQDEQHQVSLKVLNCLVKRDPNLSSWYEKYGFNICHFPQFQPLIRKDLSPTYRYLLPEFIRAKTFIRNTKAEFLIRTTLKFLPEEQKTLLELGSKYLNSQNFTIHEIFAAIYERSPKSEDLFTLYSICFKDFEEDKTKLKAFGTAAKDYERFADHFDFFTLNPILLRTRRD